MFVSDAEQSDYLDAVRLFPLPGTVFFPHNFLPLHIYESRYCEMLEDAVQKDRLIAIATLLPGYEDDYYGRPPVSPHICIGKVTAHEKNDDGTYSLLLAGIMRGTIRHEIEPVRSFRRARVDLVRETLETATSSDRALVTDIFRRLGRNQPGFDQLLARCESEDFSAAAISDILAFKLPLPTAKKLALLAEPDARVRLQMLLSSLPASRSPRQPNDPYPPSFSSN